MPLFIRVTIAAALAAALGGTAEAKAPPYWRAGSDAQAYPWHPRGASTTAIEVSCPEAGTRRFVLEVDARGRRRLQGPSHEHLFSGRHFARQDKGKWAPRPQADFHEPRWAGLSLAELVGDPIPKEGLSEPLNRGCQLARTEKDGASYAFDPVRKLWTQARRGDEVWFQVFRTERSPVEEASGWRPLPTLVVFANGCLMRREVRAGAPELPLEPK